MTDKILAIFSVVAFAIFVGVIIGFVPHPDLVIVVIVVTLMLCYDFWRELFGQKNNGE